MIEILPAYLAMALTIILLDTSDVDRMFVVVIGSSVLSVLEDRVHVELRLMFSNSCRQSSANLHHLPMIRPFL